MSDAPARRRVRVPAGSSNQQQAGTLTLDGLTNFVARYGLGQPNLLSGSTYDFHPVSRLQQLLEWAYRGSWIVGAAVDVIADDMTRQRVMFNSDMDPDEVEQLHTAANDIYLWQNLNQGIKWSRLYGGALVVMLIEGQNMADELDPESVPEGSFKGFVVLDRWMLMPSYNILVQEFGPDYGLPVFYDVIATAPFMPRMRVHYSRCVRIDGVDLPFRQRIAENGWGMSVLERIYDIMLAFNSGTMGAAQLLFRAYLRVYKVQDFRNLISVGGPALEAIMKHFEMIRMLQSNEGLTVVDATDDFQAFSYSFGGLADTLLQLGQQLSGALGIPLVRLFGQSPVGLSATGESDIRNYYDSIRSQQETRLRRPLTKIFKTLCFSELGRDLPDTFDFTFNSLWQLNDQEKADIAARDTETIVSAHGAGILTTAMALKELKQSSIITGRFTNITDEDVKDAEQEPAPWDQEAQQPGMMPGMPGMPPGLPGQPPGAPGGKPSGQMPAMPKGPPMPPMGAGQPKGEGEGGESEEGGEEA